MRHTLQLIPAFLLAALVPAIPCATAATKLVRVLILAGQFNMEGAS